MNARAGRFPYIDSLRAIAALAVVGTHAASHAGTAPVLPFAARLEAGVSVFFLISGFLLYRPFVRARLLGLHAPRVVPYAWRRALRIAPAYWVALTLVAVWVGTPGPSRVFSWNDGPLYYGFAQTWTRHTIGGGLTQGWTLSIEICFYAFLPLWAWALRGVRSMRGELTALATLFAASAAWKAGVLAGMDPHRITITPALDALPTFLDLFALGMALAVMSVWLEDRELPRPLAALQRRPGLCWALALAAFIVAAKGIGLSGRVFENFTPWQYVARHYLYALIGLGMIVPAVIGSGGLVGRVLGNRLLMWLGLISYSIYLYSGAAIHQLENWGALSSKGDSIGYVQWAIAGALATIPVAALSYYLVERPALSLKRFVGERGSIARGEAVAEPAPVAPPPAPVER